MSFVKRKVKKFLRVLQRRSAHLKVRIRVSKSWYGNEYGGFYVCPLHLNANSIVYSFGIGEDISFDREIIRRHGCQVFGFDPTPRVADWLQGQAIPNEFRFMPIGIGTTCGSLDFYLPKNPANVSGSFVLQDNVDKSRIVRVDMNSFAVIADKLGHQRIDVLKMDIEGIEYDVLPSILGAPVRISQVLVEFHDRFFPNGREKTKHSISLLQQHGFELFGVSDSFEELSFVNVKDE